jgi:phage terminase large subunit-like protein
MVSEGIYFDAVSVDLDIQFIESLTLTKSTKSGRPEPFKLLAPHRKLITNLLGWKRADGSRLYRRCYFSVARKNAKTQVAAALALVLLIMDSEAQPDIFICAKDREQASICFHAAADMARSHPELRDILTITPYLKEIRNKLNGGKLKALSSEGANKHGLSPSAVVFDELHSWSEPERELYDAMQSGSGARKSPLFLTITTAGIDEFSICGEEYAYACRVRDGLVVDPTFLPLIYEVPREADWTDETLWHLANPCLGDIVQIQDLREARDKALAVPSEQTAFRRLRLNQWVQARSVWIPLQAWDQCVWTGKAIAC